MSNLPLFPSPPAGLAGRLAALARHDVWVGTSSWKYPGWLGQIYTAERYMTRGKFSQKKFEETCLTEYAETFPIVCGDFSFYQFPAPDYWARLFAGTPETFRFALKVPEFITVKRFPSHARYGNRGGTPNESFLNVDLLQEMFLAPLAAHGEKAALLIFEFGAFSKADFESAAAFAAVLDEFLGRLPRQCRYAVEIRNREYLVPAYFDCLRRRRVAHVFNAWTRMPELAEQIQIREAFTADFTVTRALLRAGRSYEQAVAKFSPYETVKDPNPSARAALRSLIEAALDQPRAAYIFVNNRLEGNAPSTIEAIVDDDQPPPPPLNADEPARMPRKPVASSPGSRSSR
jgi:uncharacterized protein YecE (DUF72 family)